MILTSFYFWFKFYSLYGPENDEFRLRWLWNVGKRKIIKFYFSGSHMSPFTIFCFWQLKIKMIRKQSLFPVALYFYLDWFKSFVGDEQRIIYCTLLTCECSNCVIVRNKTLTWKLVLKCFKFKLVSLLGGNEPKGWSLFSSPLQEMCHWVKTRTNSLSE